jgi:hypothetical protein
MKSKIQETWQSIPTPLKFGVGVLGLFIIAKSVKSLSETLGSKGFGKNYGADVKELEKKNIKASYSDQVYLGFADTIYYEYLNEFFSDIEDILPIFSKLNNDIDYIKLTQAFGDRRLLFQANKGSLGVIIRRMFDAEEVAQINAILKKKNINAQF